MVLQYWLIGAPLSGNVLGLPVPYGRFKIIQAIPLISEHTYYSTFLRCSADTGLILPILMPAAFK